MVRLKILGRTGYLIEGCLLKRQSGAVMDQGLSLLNPSSGFCGWIRVAGSRWTSFHDCYWGSTGQGCAESVRGIFTCQGVMKEDGEAKGEELQDGVRDHEVLKQVQIQEKKIRYTNQESLQRLFKERRNKIQQLMSDLSEKVEENVVGSALETEGKMKEFMDSFFDTTQDDDETKEGKEVSVIGEVGSDSSSSSDDDELVSFEDVIKREREDAILEELKGLRRGSRRVVLQKLLQGGILRSDPLAIAELKKIEQSFRPPSGFRMKVVHVNRTSKGTRAGGMFRFSALVVVGNGEGVLGWGYGKAVEVGSAVQKAHKAAYKNLYPIPRHNGHTIPESVTAKFGKTKIIMYPKSSGRGIVANPVLATICNLAGIYDIGIKVHGSRNPLNAVKCLFAALDSLRTQDEIVGVKDGILTIPVPTGRFGKLHPPV